ncbi:hypothetical protein BofuT4_uP027060.1 [Botrytis cinerea T4]|uniref:Uncharacterized protein n=1 Tax=Botryotinia fuckeliana (strain T4) TaxID=999810 RepID=G2YAT1_BOTF4|nr:hypothetical protein BofuT4_uP027060.1 [Botrytis cinerea T4]
MQYRLASTIHPSNNTANNTANKKDYVDVEEAKDQQQWC